MLLTLEVQPDLELQLRQEAGRSGLDAKSFVLNLLRDHLSRPQAAPKDLSDKELVAEINQGLSAAEWKRYEELIDRRREETLTSDEHAELIATTERLEHANVFRVQCLAELARRRQVTMSVLMDELGMAGTFEEGRNRSPAPSQRVCVAPRRPRPVPPTRWQHLMLGAPASSRLLAWASPTGRQDAGAPSAIVGKRGHSNSQEYGSSPLLLRCYRHDGCSLVRGRPVAPFEEILHTDVR